MKNRVETKKETSEQKQGIIVDVNETARKWVICFTKCEGNEIDLTLS